MSLRVLLTGVAGFVGSHLLAHLLDNTDWHIVGVASWRHKGAPERVERVLAGLPDGARRTTIITHDLAAPFTARTAARVGPVDHVIHAAADSHVDRSIVDPVAFATNNVAVSLTVLEFARAHMRRDSHGHTGAFLQVSTDEVYGPAPDGTAHAEWAPSLPSNPYAASKVAQEALATAYWRTYGLPLVITNCMNLCGEMQDPEKYTAKLIRAIARGEVVTVHGRVVDGAPDSGARSYLHAREHASALLFLLRHGPPAAFRDGADRPDRYNIAGAEELSNLALAARVAVLMGQPLFHELVDHHATRPGHDRRYMLDATKLAALGWQPTLPFDVSLARTIAWTLEHPEWM